MLGIEDFWIWSPYVLCILSTILCVVYGAIMWNKDGGEGITQEDVEWAEEEDKISEDL